MGVVSVNKRRGGENVAWRAWAVSPKVFKGDDEWFLDDVLRYMKRNNLITIGFAEEPLSKLPRSWSKFQAAYASVYGPDAFPNISFYFANRMKKGDLVILAKNRKHIYAYGYLKDDELHYVDEKHALNKTVAKLQRQSNEVFEENGWHGASEAFRNYREVEEWIPFEGAPKNASGQIDGNYVATLAAVSLQHGLHWLGQADAPPDSPKQKPRGKKQRGAKPSNPGRFSGPNLSDLTEAAVKEALLHYELHRRDDLPTEDPSKAPYVIKYDGKLYQPWPVIVQATTDEYRKKYHYEPPNSPVCRRLLALGFPVVRHPKAIG